MAVSVEQPPAKLGLALLAELERLHTYLSAYHFSIDSSPTNSTLHTTIQLPNFSLDISIF